MIKNACFFQSLHDLLHTLRLLGVCFLCFMLQHESVIDDPCLFALHLKWNNNDLSYAVALISSDLVCEVHYHNCDIIMDVPFLSLRNRFNLFDSFVVILGCLLQAHVD